MAPVFLKSHLNTPAANRWHKVNFEGSNIFTPNLQLAPQPICYFRQSCENRYSFFKSFVLMNINLVFSKKHAAYACLALTFFICGCGKPAPEAPKSAPAVSLAKTGEQSNPSAAGKAMDVPTAVVGILHAAHRSGGVILRGECGAKTSASTLQASQSIPDRQTTSSAQSGMDTPYPNPPYPNAMTAPVTLEPMDKALQEISAKYQNIYWRESPASGVRIADSGVKAKLLRVKVREFRIVEDREPDAAITALWRAPEVAAFVRRNHVRFARRISTAKKVMSPPMIVEVKNATVADILDRIAAGYGQDPPKVWIYLECAEKKEMLIDVQMK